MIHFMINTTIYILIFCDIFFSIDFISTSDLVIIVTMTTPKISYSHTRQTRNIREATIVNIKH